jgi:3-oxoacyl-[acyl-carrier protein] reductase
MIDPKLAGKVVLITGANNPHGIGAATARAFASQGAKVLLSYLRLRPEPYNISIEQAEQATQSGEAFYHAMRMKSADEVVASLQAAGGWAKAYEANLLETQEIIALFDWAEKETGGVDILVNNAASYSQHDTIFSVTSEAFRQTFAVNAGATLLMTVEYVKRYQKRQVESGSIINFSTDAAQTFAGQITYGASKAAIEAFTRSIAIEVGHLGITVNAIAPGPTQTGYIPERSSVVSTIPLGRLGSPEDIADVAVFLASHQARWLTGQVIKVSGGHEL